MSLKPLLLFLLMVTSPSAQQTHLAGTIVDLKTNEAIPYATIGLINKDLFYRADENGKFDIVANGATDSVSFSCIGYRTVKVVLHQLPHDGLIKLSQLNTTLSEVQIGSNAPRMVKVGTNKNAAFATASFLPNQLAATFMKGSDKIGGIIKSVGFHLSNGNILAPGKGDVTAPFRIRIFEADTSGAPGAELTKDIIIVAATKSGWFDVDVSAYKIMNPERGFCVAFCLLNAEYYQDDNEKRNHSGMYSGAYIRSPKMQATENDKEALSFWGTQKKAGIFWARDMHFKDNYLIHAVVEID